MLANHREHLLDSNQESSETESSDDFGSQSFDEEAFFQSSHYHHLLSNAIPKRNYNDQIPAKVKPTVNGKSQPDSSNSVISEASVSKADVTLADKSAATTSFVEAGKLFAEAGKLVSNNNSGFIEDQYHSMLALRPNKT